VLTPNPDLLRVWFRVNTAVATLRAAHLRPDDAGDGPRNEGVIIATYTSPTGYLDCLIRGDDGRFYTAATNNLRAVVRAEPDAWQWACPCDWPGRYAIEDTATGAGPWIMPLDCADLLEHMRTRGFEPAGPWEPCGNKDTFHLKRPLRRIKENPK